MEWVNPVIDFIVEQVLAAFIAVLFGLLVAFLTREIWNRWRYGRWHIIVMDSKGVQKLDRRVSAGKVKEILAEPAEKAVFLKGVISPYAELHCDILENGPNLGLLMEDRKNRRFLIDLSKNPPGRRKSGIRK